MRNKLVAAALAPTAVLISGCASSPETTATTTTDGTQSSMCAR